METYRTFLRSALNWHDFANNTKDVQETDLTLDEARSACDAYNGNRTDNEIACGTKLEFESE